MRLHLILIPCLISFIALAEPQSHTPPKVKERVPGRTQRPTEKAIYATCKAQKVDGGFHAWELGLAYLKDKHIIQTKEQCKRFAPSLPGDMPNPDNKDLRGTVIRFAISSLMDLIPMLSSAAKVHAGSNVLCACEEIDWEDPEDGYVAHRDKKIAEIAEIKSKTFPLAEEIRKWPWDLAALEKKISALAEEVGSCKDRLKEWREDAERWRGKQREAQTLEDGLERDRDKLEEKIGNLEKKGLPSEEISERYEKFARRAGVRVSIGWAARKVENPAYKRAVEALDGHRENLKRIRREIRDISPTDLAAKAQNSQKIHDKIAEQCEQLGVLREKKDRWVKAITAVQDELTAHLTQIKEMEEALKVTKILPDVYEKMISPWVTRVEPEDYEEVGSDKGGGNLYYVNGISTKFKKEKESDEPEAMDDIQKLSEHLGRRVRLVYNPTHGAQDLDECIKDRTWIFPKAQDNATTRELAGLLLYHAERNEPVSIVAHSQGTMIANNAIKTMTLLGYDGYMKNKVKWVAAGTPLTKGEIVPTSRLRVIQNGRDPINFIGQAEETRIKGTNRDNGVNRVQHNFYYNYAEKIENDMLFP